MTVTIRRATITELWACPELSSLLNEYAAESAIIGMPHPKAKFESYKSLEDLGVLHPYAAFMDGTLIGFITVLMTVLEHYADTEIAISQSFFVGREHRKSGAGLRLLRSAEHFAEQHNSPGLIVSAPLFGELCDVLPQVGYTPASCLFFKNFSAPAPKIPKMDRASLDKVYAFEAELKKLPQLECDTTHVIHAGMYSRTLKLKAGSMMTGALVKVPTMLVVSGDAIVYVGDEAIELNGHNVLAAEGGRKQAFLAKTDVVITMTYPTSAVSVEEAEEEFTDEAHLLMTRQGQLSSSGEHRCLLR